MHFILAFHVPPDKSLDQRELEIVKLFGGEQGRFDSFQPIAYRHLVGDHAWEHPPYAYVDHEDRWYENGPVLPGWSHDWGKAVLLMTTGASDSIIVYADCHR